MSRPWSDDERRRYAMARAAERRRAELEPLRAEVDRAISALGWRRAKPIVSAVLGFAVERQRGAWWARIGKRNGARLVAELIAARERTTRQLPLWSGHDRGPGAA